MLEELRKQVYEANMLLQKYELVKLTWGNVSGIDREKGLVVIKPSGVPYEELTPENMVIVNLDGDVVEGELNPSTDTPTHLALYQTFAEIGGITHTHSKFATIWAQAGLDIPAYGTTHADYFYGDIPCTLPMEDEQINGEYEKQTGFHISGTFASRGIGPMDIPACLVASHGPFTWGKTPAKSVENSLVLEVVAEMALHTMNDFEFGLTHIQQTLLDKHYLRKHGAGAYYGQDRLNRRTTDVISTEEEQEEIEEQVMEISPSTTTVELKNIYEIGDAEKPEPEPEMPQFMRIPGTAPAEVPFNSMPSVGGSRPAPEAPQANAGIPPMPKPPVSQAPANAGIPPMPKPPVPQAPANAGIPPMPKPPVPQAPANAGIPPMPKPSAPQAPANAGIPPMPKPPAPQAPANAGIPPMPKPPAPQAPANAGIPPMPKPPAPQANAGIPPMPKPPAPQAPANAGIPPMPKPPAPQAPANAGIPQMPKPPVPQAPAAPQESAQAPKGPMNFTF